MKNFITLTKAGAVGTNVPNDLVISITGAPEDIRGEDCLKKAALFYKEQGEMLCRALLSHLPGGTVDQLTRALLEYKASLLRIVFEPDRKSTR